MNDLAMNNPPRAERPIPSRRDLLIGSMLAAAAGIAYAETPRRTLVSIGKDKLNAIVPLTIGPWRFETVSGLVQPPPDQLAALVYDQQVSRSYSASDDLPVMLLLAYGSTQSGMLQIHRPETCYPASGYRLSAVETYPLPVADNRFVPVRRFTARSDTRVEQVLYWTRVGDLLPSSWREQRWAVVRANLHGYIPDGLLVRISTISDNAAQAQATLQRFARMMLHDIGPTGQKQLIGAAIA